MHKPRPISIDTRTEDVPTTDTKVTLNSIYRSVKEVILLRQHPVTGLFPASTDINLHGDYTDAWVRDNVYTIMAPWALSRAYKRQTANPLNNQRRDELEQATVKMMRGLLLSMMRQSHKVESFKYSLAAHDSLHAKYNTATGLEVVADGAWGHLQIDATSIFLLLLAQITAGGLRLIYTQAEVDFVQNLIYYISRAYRIRDFGIWERGNKINNGKTEINASSVGMAKAALTALDGLNLYCKHRNNDGHENAVVHTIADAIARAEATLHTLLPRESRSKECDSALLSVIGFPAFAVDDQNLVQQTLDEIRTKLEGRFGCKRFLLDGHQSVLEDHSRSYYEHAELSGFENIESEWPLFFTYLYITANFNGDRELASFYRTKLENLMVEKNGFKLLPELYFVPEQAIVAEKEHPGSQERNPNDNVPLIWAQSLYTIGLLLDEGYIECDDIDPLRLHKRQTQIHKPAIALVILAQNDHVKRKLSRYGVISETLKDIQPLEVISASHLVDAFGCLGANAQLNLTGRPKRTLQSLATAHPYNINGQKLLTLSWMQDNPMDYRKADAHMLAEILHSEIKYIEKHWFYTEPAVFTLLVDKDTCDLPDIEAFFVTLRGLQHRSISEKISHATADIAKRAAHVNHMHIPGICLTTLSQSSNLSWSNLANQNYSPLLPGNSDSISQLQTLRDLCTGHQLKDKIQLGEQSLSLGQLALSVFQRARQNQDWLLMRYSYALLQEPSNELSDALSELQARRLTLVLGQPGHGHRITEALSSDELDQLIRQSCNEPLEQALIQEILLTLGNLVRTEPDLLEGLRTIRLNHLITLCAQQRSGEQHSPDQYNEDADNSDQDMNPALLLGQLTPHKLFIQVRRIFDDQHKHFSSDASTHSYTNNAEHLRYSDASRSLVLDTDWFEWRLARGLITRFDSEFLQAIWQSMNHVERIIFDDQRSPLAILDCKRALGSMTQGEENFALLIEKLTQPLHPAYYKSMIIEALSAFTEYCRSDTTLDLGHSLYLVDVINTAAEYYRHDNIEKNIENIAEHSENTKNIHSHEPPQDQHNLRSLDYLMQAPPQIAQVYIKKSLEDLATKTQPKPEQIERY